MPCVMEMADWAIRPELLDQATAKNLSIVHGDLVELITELPLEEMHTPIGIFVAPAGPPRIVWRFNEVAHVIGQVPPYADLSTLTVGDVQRAAAARAGIPFSGDTSHPIPYPICVEVGCPTHPVVM